MVSRESTPGLLIGGHTILRSVEPRDYDYLYRLATAPGQAHRWRFQGRTPSPEQFIEALWTGVVVQFLVEGRGRGPIGLVTCYDGDFQHGVAKLSLLLAPEVENTGWPFEGVLLFLRHLFQQFPFRKVYAEMSEFNFAKVASGDKALFNVEGRLIERLWSDDRYWDVHILSVDRHQVHALNERFYGWSAGSPAQTTPTGTIGVEQFAQLVAEIAERSPAELSEGSALSDLVTDSLMLVELVHALEARFGLTLPYERLPKLPGTLGELYAFVLVASERRVEGSGGA